MKLGAVVIISKSKLNGIGNNEVPSGKLLLGFCSMICISLESKISEIANVSASSTTKPGKIRDSAKSVPTAETTKIIARPIKSVRISI